MILNLRGDKMGFDFSQKGDSNPFAETKDEKKKWNRVVVFSIVCVVVVVGLAALFRFGINQPTGSAALSDLDEVATANMSYTNETSEGGTITDSSGLAENGAGTGQTITNINLKADIKPENYEIALSNIDVELNAESLLIVTDAMDIEISLKGPITLKDFRGYAVWKDSTFYLEGQLYEYLSDYIKIDWKTQQSMKVKINDGTITINKVVLDSWDVVVSGDIGIDSKMTLNLDKERIYIKDYKGPFEVSINNSINNIKLDGTTSLFSAETENFDIDVR